MIRFGVSQSSCRGFLRPPIRAKARVYWVSRRRVEIVGEAGNAMWRNPTGRGLGRAACRGEYEHGGCLPDIKLTYSGFQLRASGRFLTCPTDAPTLIGQVKNLQMHAIENRCTCSARQ
jgi:hypothetical protein